MMALTANTHEPQATPEYPPPGPGAHSLIPVGRKHRFEALDAQVELIEVSTPELDDVIRLEDDYSRQGKSDP